MNVLASLILVVVVIVVGTRLDQDNNAVHKETQEVQGVESETMETPSVTSSPASTVTSIFPEPTVTTSTPKPEVTNNDEYIYPGSVIINSNYEMLKLKSSDNPDTITQWYKEKIKNAGMNVNSFVTTKTNGNVLNKLSAADEAIEIKVEIKKQASDSKVEISVNKLVN